jgi:hypothetical protein
MFVPFLDVRSNLVLEPIFTFAVGRRHSVPPLPQDRKQPRFDFTISPGRDHIVSTIDAQPRLGLSVSPNRKTILFTEFVSGVDLLLIEDFR